MPPRLPVVVAVLAVVALGVGACSTARTGAAGGDARPSSATGSTSTSPPGSGAPGSQASPDTPSGTAGSADEPAPDGPVADETPRPDPLRAGRLVAYGRGGLPAGVVAAASAVEGVVAATLVRSDTVGLTGSRDAEGAAVDAPPAGFQIPLDLAAVDPAPYAATLPREADGVDTIAALAPGQALLSASSAARRGLGVGATLDLVGRSGLVVVGVVDDALVGLAEIVVHTRDAGDLGVRPTGAVYLRHAPLDADGRARVRERVAAVVPADIAARVVGVGGRTDAGSRRSAPSPRGAGPSAAPADGPGGAGPAPGDAADADEQTRPAPLVLSLTQLKDTFGEFAFRPLRGTRNIEIDPAFVAERIVTAEVPVLGSVRCHRDIIGPLRAAIEEVVAAGLQAELAPSRYGGCFSPRRISEASSSLSHHAWGIAIDVNVDLSLPGLGPPPSPATIAAFERQGFRWGGDFLVPDNHHFEWLGPAAVE